MYTAVITNSLSINTYIYIYIYIHIKAFRHKEHSKVVSEHWTQLYLELSAFFSWVTAGGNKGGQSWALHVSVSMHFLTKILRTLPTTIMHPTCKYWHSTTAPAGYLQIIFHYNNILFQIQNTKHIVLCIYAHITTHISGCQSAQCCNALTLGSMQQ